MKIISITLDGKERNLDLGKFYFTKFFGETLGADPALLTNVSPFDYTVATVYAGMLTYCKVHKTEPDFTKAEIEDWIGCMEVAEVNELATKLEKAIKGEPLGE